MAFWEAKAQQITSRPYNQVRVGISRRTADRMMKR
jgi:hypothetical protein